MRQPQIGVKMMYAPCQKCNAVPCFTMQPRCSRPCRVYEPAHTGVGVSIQSWSRAPGQGLAVGVRLVMEGNPILSLCLSLSLSLCLSISPSLSLPLFLCNAPALSLSPPLSLPLSLPPSLSRCLPRGGDLGAITYPHRPAGGRLSAAFSAGAFSSSLICS